MDNHLTELALKILKGEKDVQPLYNFGHAMPKCGDVSRTQVSYQQRHNRNV